MGTTGQEVYSLPGIFKGHPEGREHHKRRGALPDTEPYLGIIPFHGDCLLNRKENSAPAPGWRLPVRLRYRTSAPKDRIPSFRFGNINPIPFR